MIDEQLVIIIPERFPFRVNHFDSLPNISKPIYENEIKIFAYYLVGAIHEPGVGREII